MRKIIVLFLVVAGAWFAGYVSGAGIPGPGEPVPVILDLNNFETEMLIADRWTPVNKIAGANVSLAIDPKFGKCLKIDYIGENYFGYYIEPTDLSGYDKVQFKIKGSGDKGVFVFSLFDEKGTYWGFCEFMATGTDWVTLEAMLHFPTYDKDFPFDLKKVTRIVFYENEAGGHLTKPSSVYVTDFKLIKEEEAVSARPTVSSLNSNGNMVADGKPFFPLSIYSTIGTNDGQVLVSAVPGWFKDLKEAGFNMVQSYTVRSKEDYKSWLDSAQAAGLKVMTCTYPLIVQTPLPGEPAAREAEITKRKATLKAEIETVRDHPAMAVYLTSDEIYNIGIPKEQLQIFYDYIRSMDTVHPTLIVECTDAGFPTYRNATDMLGPDIYPIGNHKPYPTDITSIAKRLDQIKTVQRGTPPKPVLWVILQIFKSDGDDTRFPTEGEMRAMSFLALTRDVKGLLYFIYNWPNYTLPYSQSQPEHWGHVSNAINSIHTVFPALFSDKTVIGYKVNSDKIYSIAKEVTEGGKKYLYLLAVHPSDGKKLAAPLTITFKDLPAGEGTIQVLDEETAGGFKLGSIRKIEGSLSGFTDTFGENAVHVYKMELK